MGVNLDAYDEYFDSLTGSERNRELGGARPAPVQEEEVQKKPRHWLIRAIGYYIEGMGMIIEYTGKGTVWIGRWIRGAESKHNISKDSP